MAHVQIAGVVATLPDPSPPVRTRTLARAERRERAAAAYDAPGEDGHLGRRDWANDHRRPRARPTRRPARRRRRRGRPPAKNDRRAGRRREQVSLLPRGLDPDRSVRHIHVLVPRIAAQDAPAWARHCSPARRRRPRSRVRSQSFPNPASLTLRMSRSSAAVTSSEVRRPSRMLMSKSCVPSGASSMSRARRGR